MKDTRKYSDLIYDVGLHHGEDTDYYLKKGFRVIGFEADPDLAAGCRRKFSDQIKTGKVTIVEGAIVPVPSGGAVEKTIKFYKNKEIDVWGTVVEDWARRNEHLGTSSQVIEVPIVNFSECLQNFGIPHYLKIDIEGMDAVCVEALFNFEQKPDYISRESDCSSFEKVTEDFNLLSQLGTQDLKVFNRVASRGKLSPIQLRRAVTPAISFKRDPVAFLEKISLADGRTIRRWPGNIKESSFYISCLDPPAGCISIFSAERSEVRC